MSQAQTSRSQRVGFIGLGHIGVHMARCLCKAGFEEVVVHDLLPEAMQPVIEAGATAAGGAREIGERCDVIGVCVVDDAATEAVVAGILEGAKAGTVIAVHGTVHPETVRSLGAMAADHGVQLIDAQMTGGPAKAQTGELRYMVGGDADAVAKATPFLEASAAEITHCGDLGTGAIAKLCNNLSQYGAWMLFVEAYRLGRESGLTKETLDEVLSWIMNDNARVMMAGRDALEANPDNEVLVTSFTNALLLAEKDLTLALEVGREAGISMPGTALTTHQLARMFAVPDPKRR